MKKKHNILLRYSVVFATGLLMASSGKADSILQTAGNFAVLGGTEVTNTGATFIRNGNVGVSPGTSITGFPPGDIINGVIVTDTLITAQARTDLMKAQAGLNAMVPDQVLASGNLTGLTLAPGVYRINSAATLSGQLILDGQGKNNAYWVFQIEFDLTTAAPSSVQIINPGSNGGSDYGIFWNCGSAITIGANNALAGIYLAGTSITFGQYSTRGGRALALAAVTLNTNDFNARSGPGGGDYSGGLSFDADGNVVPTPVIEDEVKPPLSFSYNGRKRRVMDRTKRVIRGIASTTATTIQYRLNKNKWRSVPVLSNQTWSAKITRIPKGYSRVKFRALDAAGSQTGVKRLTIRRVAS